MPSLAALVIARAALNAIWVSTSGLGARLRVSARRSRRPSGLAPTLMVGDLGARRPLGSAARRHPRDYRPAPRRRQLTEAQARPSRSRLRVAHSTPVKETATNECQRDREPDAILGRQPVKWPLREHDVIIRTGCAVEKEGDVGGAARCKGGAQLAQSCYREGRNAPRELLQKRVGAGAQLGGERASKAGSSAAASSSVVASRSSGRFAIPSASARSTSAAPAPSGSAAPAARSRYRTARAACPCPENAGRPVSAR